MAPQDAVDTEYPVGIGRTARRVLELNGYTRCEQLTGVSAAELPALHGVGPKAVRILGEEPAARGLAFGA